MKLNIKYRPKFATFFAMLTVACFVASFAACSDDDSVSGDPYLELGERIKVLDTDQDVPVANDYELNLGSGETSSIPYYMLTNLGDWKIETEKAEDASWIDIWPNVGYKDGRFYLKVAINRTFEARTSKINIVSNGTVQRSFVVNQSAGSKAIWLSLTTLTVDAQAHPLLITVNTNRTGGWIATSNVQWLTIVRQTDNQIVMQVDKYEYKKDALKREATVSVTSMDEPTLKADFKLTQSPPTAEVDL